MSYWSDNPEMYEEIVRKGIVKYIDKFVDKAGFSVDGNWLEAYTALVESLEQDESSKFLYDTFERLANNDIINAEADYWGNKADSVMNTRTEMWPNGATRLPG